VDPIELIVAESRRREPAVAEALADPRPAEPRLTARRGGGVGGGRQPTTCDGTSSLPARLIRGAGGGARRVILDATGEGYVAAVGTISGSTLTGEIAGARPRATQEHLELLIANDPEIGAQQETSAGPR
jgi:hypothetical protein